MKRVIYKGLLALTIAFGVTSCDKNEMDDIAAPTVGVVANDNYSKLGFLENGVSIAPIKGAKNDVASKNASEFSHLYGSGLQTLEILKGTDVVYTGSYTPNDIASLEPATIILANGDYTINTVNNADQTALVLGFLPYTSTVDVSLSADVDVTLQATLLRGFVIADSQRAEEGTRITSVVLSLGEASGNLILDDSDTFNDFYGYLRAGDYGVVINYTLDGSPSSKSGNVTIVDGVATTLLPILTGETPVSSETTTSTQSGFEGTAENRPTGDSNDYDLYSIGNQNSDSDSDVSDSYTRLVSSTIVTTAGDAGDATFEYGAWILNVDASGVTVEDENGNGPGDGSAPADTTEPVITLASDLPADGGLIATDYTFTITSDDADAVIVWSKNGSIVSGESGLTYTTQFGNANGDKVISVSVTDAADNVASESLTFTVSEPAVDGVDVWEDNGDEIGGDETFTNDGSPVLGYSYDGGAFGSLVDAQAAADAAIAAEGDTVVMIQVQSVQSRLRQVSAVIQPEIYVVNGEQDGDIEAGAMRSTQVVTAAVVDGVADDAAPVAGDDVSYTVSNAITNTDVTWTDSTAAGKTSYVGSDTDYNFAVEGALADVIVSGISFPEAISIVVPAYIGGVAFPGVSDTTYTFQSSQVIVLGAPIADVVALIQAAINQ